MPLPLRHACQKTKRRLSALFVREKVEVARGRGSGGGVYFVERGAGESQGETSGTTLSLDLSFDSPPPSPSPSSTAYVSNCHPPTTLHVHLRAAKKEEEKKPPLKRMPAGPFSSSSDRPSPKRPPLPLFPSTPGTHFTFFLRTAVLDSLPSSSAPSPAFSSPSRSLLSVSSAATSFLPTPDDGEPLSRWSTATADFDSALSSSFSSSDSDADSYAESDDTVDDDKEDEETDDESFRCRTAAAVEEGWKARVEHVFEWRKGAEMEGR
ncbi:hypothetical protein JCM6882_009370 [Rhodosporidiobolus microsporus]